MRGLNDLINGLSKHKTWFDVAADCFSFIKNDCIEVCSRMTEEAFISRYIDICPKSSENNPNIAQLLNLKSDIEYLIIDNLNAKLSFINAINSIKTRMFSMNLIDFGDDTLNRATIPWMVVLAIDESYQNKYYSAKKAPLNKNAINVGYGVYLRCPHAALEEILEEQGLSRMPAYSLRDQLSNLIIMEKNRLQWFPRVLKLSYEFVSISDEKGITLWDEQNQVQEMKRSVNLRLGICSFSGVNYSGFGKTSPIRFYRSVGTSFAVKYSEECDRLFDLIVKPALEKAIEQGCNIVVFPEIVFALSFQGKLSKYLSERSDASNLMLVVAGSSWDELHSDNYSCIFTRSGYLLGKYYKQMPFSDLKGASNLIEGILKPEEPSLLIDIPGLGRLLPAICKDIIDHDSPTFDVMEKLKPQLVAIPSFSRSLERGFASPLERVAERNLAISFIANYCAIRKPDCTSLGYVVCPKYKMQERKSRTDVELVEIGRDHCFFRQRGNRGGLHRFRNIKKRRGVNCRRKRMSKQMHNCLDKCGLSDHGSCIHVVDIHYSNSENHETYPQVSVSRIELN